MPASINDDNRYETYFYHFCFNYSRVLVFFGTLPVSLSFSVLELNAFVKGAIEGFLSGLALLIFFAILPLVSTDRIICHVD